MLHTHIKYTGDSNAIGYFSGGDENLLFESGIVLSSGDVKNAKGPNISESTATGFNTKGDSDLEKLVSGYKTKDAAVLEFDFIPFSDTIVFQYIFASEEYPEFVASSYNDVFAFFLSGKNPDGGKYKNVNIAVLPNTTIPVSINNVNSLKNSNYYKNNTGGLNIEYDGLTIPLTAKAKVVSGEKYHIKIAISDVSDTNLDSGVFLKATSFHSETSLSYEGNCLFNEIQFNLSNSKALISTFWNFGDINSGTKNNSTKLNPTHKFSKSGTYEITIISKYPERIDTITETIKIVGQEIDLGKDFEIKKGDNAILDAGIGGESYLWSTGETKQKITISQAGKYSVTVTFGKDCSTTDTIKISIGDEKCPCCLLALIFGILMAITSLILFFVCRRHNNTEVI